MPLPSGKATFEEALVLMQSSSDPLALMRHIPIFTEGLDDLKNRMSAIEKSFLQVRQQVMDSTAKADQSASLAASIVSDRDHMKAHLDAMAAAPNTHKQRLDELDQRIRTVEGAVGASLTTVAPSTPAAPEV